MVLNSIVLNLFPPTVSCEHWWNYEFPPPKTYTCIYNFIYRHRAYRTIWSPDHWTMHDTSKHILCNHWSSFSKKFKSISDNYRSDIILWHCGLDWLWALWAVALTRLYFSSSFQKQWRLNSKVISNPKTKRNETKKSKPKIAKHNYAHNHSFQLFLNLLKDFIMLESIAANTDNICGKLYSPLSRGIPSYYLANFCSP